MFPNGMTWWEAFFLRVSLGGTGLAGGFASSERSICFGLHCVQY